MCLRFLCSRSLWRWNSMQAVRVKPPDNTPSVHRKLKQLLRLSFPHNNFLAVGAADADCTNGQRCVDHLNFASSSSCDSAKYCEQKQTRVLHFRIQLILFLSLRHLKPVLSLSGINVSKTSCSCEDGLTCRLKDCPSSPYECVFLENEETRCGGSKAPMCSSTEICGYVSTNLDCIRCPCYGTQKAVCVTRTSEIPCGDNSIVFVKKGGAYTCNGCASATSVLTG
ncbi:hypothetical protein V5799_014411 [Amblyomma americanum]|uniref:Uncharacterized protein n=1 Tax=Amblyomma americanum TaxID=6943 RepID=A0AAQ4E334_AMBAM